MKRIENINSVTTNFRAEVLASGLIETGVEADTLCIVRHKGNKKDVSKDIDTLEYRYPEYDMKEHLFIFSNRESIYDSLPEGLFHHTAAAQSKSKEAIIEQIKQQRDREKITRTFFQPFEMAIDKVLIDAQLHEQKYDKPHIYNNLTSILNEYWSILQFLSTVQALLFIKVIPIIEDACKDFDTISKVMAIILNCPVSISQGQKSYLSLDNLNAAKLKECKLGVTSVLGSKVEYNRMDLIINVGPLSLEQMKLFQSNQKNDLILKELIALLMPYDRNFKIKYQINSQEAKFRLSDNCHTAYLGINTTL